MAVQFHDCSQVGNSGAATAPTQHQPTPPHSQRRSELVVLWARLTATWAALTAVGQELTALPGCWKMWTGLHVQIPEKLCSKLERQKEFLPDPPLPILTCRYLMQLFNKYAEENMPTLTTRTEITQQATKKKWLYSTKHLLQMFCY